jgi:hypothetical protein
MPAPHSTMANRPCIRMTSASQASNRDSCALVRESPQPTSPNISTLGLAIAPQSGQQGRGPRARNDEGWTITGSGGEG